MTVTTVEGAFTLTAVISMPLPFDPNCPTTAKAMEESNHVALNLMTEQPGTSSYGDPTIAAPRHNNPAPSNHNGTHKPVNLDAICQEIKCETNNSQRLKTV